MARQLTFDLPVRPTHRRGDFFVSPSNRAALDEVDAWRGWPGGKLVLTGPEGAGKTHLAHVWAGLSDAVILPASDLAGADIAALAGRNVAVEDAGAVAASDPDEAALFHLHNLVLAEGGALLLTARDAPGRWNLALPDLASRMQASRVARLAPPDDALLAAVLVKLFGDRQIAVPPATIGYLIRRIDRSLADAARVVRALDRAALAENRAVTRALAARVLDNPDGPEA